MRPGIYYLLYPTYNQGRKICWDGILQGGLTFNDFIPKEILLDKSEVEMSSTVKAPGNKHSINQVVGADKFDRIVGPNPVGVVFSEYSLMSPAARNLLLPTHHGGRRAALSPPDLGS
jgi:hypothetical protein